MFRNHLKTALRNLWKHKAFSFINLLGLTIGLTSFMLIALFLFDELSYDSIHERGNEIYRLVENQTSADGKNTKRSGTGYLVSIRAKRSLPEIRDVARISSFWRPDIRTSESKANVFHEDFVAANPGFLTVFSFPLIYGDRTTALNAPKSVILTEQTAQRFFNSTNVVGKFLFFDNDSIPYTVTGVLKNFPANSSISFNLLVSESTIVGIGEASKHFSDDWTSGAFTTYFHVNKSTDPTALSQKLDHLIASNRKAEPGMKTRVQLQSLKDIHFYSNDIEGNSGKKGNIYYIYIFFCSW